MNKGRLTDILLIATLVLVAFGITYTLLTLNRGQTRPPPPRDGEEVTSPAPDDSAADAPARSEAAAGDDGLPVIPDALRDDDGDAAAADADDDADVDADADEVAAAEDEDDEAAAEEEDEPPRELAAGEVELESVGFSFVTGGAGACGVVLEPWEHVAVSRDILADLGCGAEVHVTLDDETGGRNSFTAVIGDTMNPSHSMTVNVYVGEDEPALEYGRTSGTLVAD